LENMAIVQRNGIARRGSYRVNRFGFPPFPTTAAKNDLVAEAFRSLNRSMVMRRGLGMPGKTVTRQDLYRAVQREVGLSAHKSAVLVEQVLMEITTCLEPSEAVKLSSFGLFVVRRTGPRIGRNPRTGGEVPISPRRVISFKPSTILKQRINLPSGGLSQMRRDVDTQTAVPGIGRPFRIPQSSRLPASRVRRRNPTMLLPAVVPSAAQQKTET
jgi:integration host factor subunit alpha